MMNLDDRRARIMRLAVALSVAAVLGLPAGMDAAPKEVSFTYSHHPLLTSPNNLQALFNGAAAFLKSDDDGDGSGDDDDVSFDVTFKLTEDAGKTFPDQSAGTFPAAQRYNYKLSIYNEIPNDTVGNQLREATFADLKQVTSGHDFTGWAMLSNKTIIFTQEAIKSTTAHEWGHNCGLKHRDGSKLFIMYPTAEPGRNEINVTERAAMQNYVP